MSALDVRYFFCREASFVAVGEHFREAFGSLCVFAASFEGPVALVGALRPFTCGAA